jgi:uncharacterized membrane protein
LVLPLLEIEPPEEGQTIWEVMGGNRGTLLAFVLSFVITLSYWRRHHRMLDGLASFTPRLVWLNGLWLLALVFLQYPTEALGRSGPDGGTLTLYAAVLAVLAWLGVLMTLYLRRTPGLVPADRLISTRQIKWTAATAGYMSALAVFALFAPEAALWALLGLVLLGWIESWQLARQPPEE